MDYHTETEKVSDQPNITQIISVQTRIQCRQCHVLFIIGNWNTKVGSQNIPGITGRFGLGEQNEAE